MGITDALRVLVDIFVCVLALFAVIFIFIATSPFWIWRFTVKILGRILKRNQLDGMLSVLDNLLVPYECADLSKENFHLKTSRTLFILGTLSGSVNLVRFRENFAEKVLRVRNGDGRLRYARLQQHVTFWLGYAFFEWDKTFDISLHIRVLEANVTERTVNAFVSSRFNEPFQKESSKWEMILVPNYTNEDRTLLLFRFCHSIGDGFSIMKLFNKEMLGLDSYLYSPNQPKKRDENCEPNTICQSIKEVIQAPRKYLRESSEIGKASFSTSSLSRDGGHCWLSSTEPIPIEKFKRLKAEHGSSFTEVTTLAISIVLNQHFGSNLQSVVDTNMKWIPGFTIAPDSSHPNDQLVNAL
jgi:hypothetical protein